jgi:hypothetical protein
VLFVLLGGWVLLAVTEKSSQNFVVVTEKKSPYFALSRHSGISKVYIISG